MDPWLLSAARKHPERAALETRERTLSYAELEEAAMSAVTHLQAAGLATGDRVALEIEDRLEFLVALHACLLLGAPAVPIDLRLNAAERETRRRGAAAVLREAPRAEGRWAASTSEEAAVATVMHTSGTTSEPK